MKLFPEESVVFIRLANAHEFGERFSETGTGRMIRDPQLKPFVENLYGGIGRVYTEEVQEKLGISWDDLKNLPKGEVAFAVVARPDARPALLLLIDQGDEPSVAERFVNRALEIAGERGAEFSTEEIADVEVTVVRDPERERRQLGFFQRENTIVAATDPDVLRQVLWAWDGADPDAAEKYGRKTNRSESNGDDDDSNSDNEGDDADAETEGEESAKEAEFIPGRTLAENDRFVAILRTCRRQQDPPPNLIWFVDPIEVVRGFGRNNSGVQFAMGLLPALGADGLMAIGGAATYATGQYDDLHQLHVLLENPRSGVLQLPAFESGDTAPPVFVPHAVETYMGLRWNLRTTYDRLVALVDQYRYEGATEKFMKERISDKVGVDVPTEIFDNLTGRFAWTIAYERPARLRGQQHTIAAELKDVEAMQETVKKIMEKYPDVFEERKFGNVTYHAILPPGLREMEEDERPAEPFFAIMDGWLFAGGSCKLFEQCIAARDGTVERLIDSDDFVRMTEVLGRETAGQTPVIFSISRFEETLRQWHGLLMSEEVRALIEEHREDNKVLAALSDAMEESELPPFEVLAPYLAPGGSILYDTDNGYHAIGFTLRNEVAGE